MERLVDQATVIKVTKALADPTRFGILQSIATHGEQCCGDLAKQFPITQATCSQHLKILAEASLVTMRREGQFNYYTFVPGTFASYQQALSKSFIHTGVGTSSSHLD
jgi:ArsR family transcriptional regulator, arsenate/arsenite/antimonite-responsive transcriptional repressor